MIIKLNENTVTPFNFCKNGEKLTIEIEKIYFENSNKYVGLGIFAPDKNLRGNIKEIPNNFLLSENTIDFIPALYQISDYLSGLGLVKDTNFFLKESDTAFPEGKNIKVSVSYSTAATVADIRNLVARMESAGYTFEERETYGFIYLEEIYPEDLAILRANNYQNFNILIETN